jgi:hypothetical protein
MHMPSSLFDDPAELHDEEIDDDLTYEDDDPQPPAEFIESPLDEEDDSEPESVAAGASAEEASIVDEAAPHPPVSKRARFGDLRLEYRHWTNPRTITGLEDAKIAELAQSIRDRTISDENGTVAGLTDPMKVVAIRNNGRVDLLVYDGQRRHLATQKVFGKGSDDVLVPVIWRHPEPVEWTPDLSNEVFREAVHGATTREGLSAFELSEIAERMRASNDPDTGQQTTLAAIAALLVRSESWVSKILTARKNATPKLLAQWRTGSITEEQFRDLAVVKDKDAQSSKAEEIAAARGRGEGRRAAKEQKLIARREEAASKPAKPSKAEPIKTEKKGKNVTVVRGPQAELPMTPAPAPEPKRPKPMHFAAIEDVVSTAERHPPTHDMVKGVILGLKVASGMLDAADLPKPWHQYLTWVAGRAAKKEGKTDKPSARKKGKKK